MDEHVADTEDAARDPAEIIANSRRFLTLAIDHFCSSVLPALMSEGRDFNQFADFELELVGIFGQNVPTEVQNAIEQEITTREQARDSRDVIKRLERAALLVSSGGPIGAEIPEEQTV